MKNIEFIANLALDKISATEKPKEAKQVFNGTRRQLLKIELRNNEVLSRHKAAEPITVFCLAGNVTFRAGRDLEDEQKLVAGTLITLAAEVEHEVTAEPDISLLVTKFKAE